MFTIYTQPRCNSCIMAKRLLEQKGEPYIEIDITENVSAKEKIKGMGFKTVPQIFYPDGKHFGDYEHLEKTYV